MPHRTFLIWNALAAIASTCVAALGAYGIGAGLLGQLSAKRGVLALAVAALPLAALLALIRHADTRIESRGVGLELHRMAISSYRAAPTPRMLRFSVERASASTRCFQRSVIRSGYSASVRASMAAVNPLVRARVTAAVRRLVLARVRWAIVSIAAAPSLRL
jgi:hypothetical protein